MRVGPFDRLRWWANEGEWTRVFPDPRGSLTGRASR
jgi:hypothetical protein